MTTDIGTIKADIEICQHRIRALQSETIHCIAIKSSGKVEVVDKEKLESLNSEVARLEELAGHNNEVAERLRETLAKASTESIGALFKAVDTSEQRIARYRETINQSIGTWLKVDSYRYDLSNIRTHPRVKGELEKYEPLIPIEEANRKHLSEVLEEAQVVLQDFQPSGLPEIKQKRAVGLVTFEQPAPVPVV
jgi:hypothetical protein